MNENINHPYAKLFELVMSLPSEVKKLLEHFGAKKLKNILNLDTLKVVNNAYKGGKTGLSNLFLDKLYDCKSQEDDIRVNLLFEHKSYLENPMFQALEYHIAIHKEDELAWLTKRDALRKAGKTVPRETFYFTPVITILFYHGEQEWKDYKFSDQFKFPKKGKWMADYTPNMAVFVINMADFSDEDIDNIGPSFLQPMLYMFKHKGDKNFLLQNVEKIFKFVEVLKIDRFVKEFIKTVFFFMIQTFKLKDKDVQKVLKHLPFQNSNDMNAVQETVVTVIDEAVQRGLLQGIKKGEAKGKEIGKEVMKEIMEIKKPMETILKLVKTVPDLTSSQLATICNVKETFVLEVLKTFKNKKELIIKKFVRSAFKKIEKIEEKDFLQLETELIAIWKKWNENSK